jgi:hypothetical protein
MSLTALAWLALGIGIAAALIGVAIALVVALVRAFLEGRL